MQVHTQSLSQSNLPDLIVVVGQKWKEGVLCMQPSAPEQDRRYQIASHCRLLGICLLNMGKELLLDFHLQDNLKHMVLAHHVFNIGFWMKVQ